MSEENKNGTENELNEATEDQAPEAVENTGADAAGDCPATDEDPIAKLQAENAELKDRLPRLIEHYEAMEFRKAAAETRDIWAAGNEYLTKAEPWVKYKSDVDAAAIGVRAGLNLAALFGIIAQPIIPGAAKKILDALNIPEENRNFPAADADFAGLLDALPHPDLVLLEDC